MLARRVIAAPSRVAVVAAVGETLSSACRDKIRARAVARVRVVPRRSGGARAHCAERDEPPPPPPSPRARAVNVCVACVLWALRDGDNVRSELRPAQAARPLSRPRRALRAPRHRRTACPLRLVGVWIFFQLSRRTSGSCLAEVSHDTVFLLAVIGFGMGLTCARN